MVQVWLQLCFSLLFFFSGASTTTALEVVLLQDEPAADSLVEWELRGVDAAWLTSDVSRTPIFQVTSPNNRSWERRAFLYQPCQASKADAAAIPMGDLVLRFRHTPRVDGAHKWVIKAPDGSELSSGILKVTKKTGAYPLGMLQVSTDNPRLLAFKDGSVFIPIGPNLCWANAPNQLGKFSSWFEILGKEKCNHVRLWCASWCGRFRRFRRNRRRTWHFINCRVHSDVALWLKWTTNFT